MKPLVIAAIVLVLFLAGIGGGFLILVSQRGTEDPAPAAVPDDSSSLHGKTVDVPENAVICADHHVAEVMCPFCKPSLIETLGYCGAHDVAEALCTRCSPALIAAFKAVGDWCDEHGLPESQCATCNPAADG
jgi:hypothetical protein